MNLFAHFVVSLALAAAFYPFFGSYALLVLLTGFFIDLDHYLAYIFMTGDFNPFRANNYFLEKKPRNVFCVLHTVEFIAVIVVFSVFSTSGFILLAGLISHHIMDFYNGLKLNRLNSKVIFMIPCLVRLLR